MPKLTKLAIILAGSFVFGLDSDTKDIFRQTFDFINDAHIDMPRFTINTPFPGTPFYEKMKQENRIIEHDWSMYDCCHVVIKPENMTAKELQEGFHRICKEAYKISSIIKRIELLNPFSFPAFLANIGLKVKCNNMSKCTRDIMADNSDI